MGYLVIANLAYGIINTILDPPTSSPNGKYGNSGVLTRRYRLPAYRDIPYILYIKKGDRVFTRSP